ncbi:MAG: DEAD/DEAH box helicase [Emcibacter sp.]|nr:DEAD/DEAH box helicase [Emcibacter sp.]
MTHDNAPIIEESGFEIFDLAETILKSIEKEGFTTPTPIQTMAIPPLMDGNDLMGIAQTGGGKTAAFALPIINKLLQDYQKPRQNMPKVLILAPTRELAMQIEQCIVTFSKGTNLKSLVVAGGQPYPPQTTNLRRGVDILVATPGRLIDHINRNNVKFADTNIFVLDEADRMLDMGFIDDVQDISKSLPEDHQTILFSATMNPKVRDLSKTLLKDPVFVDIQSATVVAGTISHKLMNVSRKNKTQLLAEILAGDDVEKALVFARTKMGADELSDALLEQGIQADAIHGDKRQRVREKILMNFRRGRTKVLVATDVAARGIDVDGISHVVNYELPIEPENYIHRVGRTGRAGNKGIAISFCDPSDMRLLVHIERLIKQPIEVDADHEYHIDVTTRGKEGGKKGRFSREGKSRGEGGFNRSRSDRGFREKREDRTARSENRPFRSEDRPARIEGHVNRGNMDKPRTFVKSDKKPWTTAEKNENRKTNKFAKPVRSDNSGARVAKAYDPWAGAKEYSDDPVLGKIIGKAPKINSKKEDKSKFVKSGAAKKTSFKKKEADAAPSDRKKVRGGKKVVAGARQAPRLSKSKTKDNGGNKAFSPKRKILSTSKAA